MAALLVAFTMPLLGASPAAAGPTDVLTISDVSQVETDTGETNFVFTVTFSGSTAPLGGSATYVTAGVSATGGEACGTGVDFVTTSGTVTFPVNDTSETITVPVCGDTLAEPTETFEVRLTSSDGNCTTSGADCVGTGTITTDDAFVSIADSSVAEGNGGTTNLSFTATLSSPSARAVKLNYSTADITASAGSDYTTTLGTITFAPGDTSETIVVPIAGDTLAEADETFAVTLTVAEGNATCAGGDCQAIGTIANDDAAPRTLSVGDVTVEEGDSGTTNATFTIRQSGLNAQDVRVRYDTADDTAASGSDYTGTGGVATIPAGQLSVDVTVPVIGDTVDEIDESYLVNLTSPMNATCAGGDCEGRGTITDDEATPTVSVSNPTVAEGNAGTVNAVFDISLSGASSRDISVTYGTADGTATAGADYTARTGTATVIAGSTSTTVTVPVQGDTIDEADETFALNLTNPQNAACTGGDCEGTATITDDDVNPALSIDDQTVTEGNTATTNAVFTVTLNTASGRPVTVDYATTNGTATAGSDYTATTGTLTFVAGDTSETITVPVTPDLLDEPDETFTVTLSNAVDAAIADPSGAGTITDDDGAPSVSIDDVTTPEPSPGSTDAVFTVALSAPSSQTITVDYATVDGTATAGSDYTHTSGKLTFPAGVTMATVAVPVLADSAVEGNETYNLTLTPDANAAPCTSGDCVGTGTIIDDETPSLSVSDAGVTEADTGTTNAVFTVTLSTKSTQPVTFTYETADGSATAGTDYTTTSGRREIPAGSISTDISVPVIGDDFPEPNETFFLNLSSPSGATITDGQGQGTITSDSDGTVSSISVDDVTVLEGTAATPTTATFTVTQSSSNNPQAVTVTYTTGDGAATAPGDYVAKTGTVTLAAGETTKTFTVEVVADNIDEVDEAFLVNLSNASNASIADGSGQVTIDDDDGPALSIDDVTVTEGDAGTTTAAFTVSVSGSSVQPVTVDFGTADGTATVAANDYAANTGTVTFPAGSTDQIVNVLVNGDTTDELTELFTIKLSNAVDATIADGEGEGTITDDDAPGAPVITSVEDDGSTPATGNDPTPRIIVSGVTAGDTVTLLDGAAVEATKTATETSVTFNALESDEEVSLLGEGAHSLTAKATDGAANTSAASTPFVYNLDTVTPGTPTIDSIEGDSISPATGNDTTPTVLVSGVVAGDTITIMEGATELTSKVVGVGQTTVTFNADEADSDLTISDDEPHSLTATSTDGAGNTSQPSAAFVYTRDTAAPGAPTIFSVEGDEVTPASGNDTTPNILVSDAAEGETITLLDGTTVLGTLVVPTGATTVTFNPEETNSDAILSGDGNHSLTATRSDVAGNTGAASDPFVYNLDTAAPATPAIGSVEGDDTTPASGNDTTPVVVVSGVVAGDTVKIFDGTIEKGSKVVPPEATTVTFNGGEVDEVTLAGDGPHSLTATSTDSDANTSDASDPFVYNLDTKVPVTPSITIGDVSLDEGNSGTSPATFRVALSEATGQPVSVAYATANGTATAPGDYAVTSGTLTFAAGETTRTIAVPVVGDTTVEPDQTFTLNLTSPTNATIGDAQGVATIVNDDTAAVTTTTTTTTPNTGTAPQSGYRLVAKDGGIFSFGDAKFFGSTGATKLNQPIVGMAETPSGNGYFLVASDGGIFAFGDAVFRGSTGAIKLNRPIVGMASTPSGGGYFLVASDGGIFAFGDAVFKGSTGAIKLAQPIVGMTTTPTGGGYFLVASDGGIFAFGDALFKGSTGAMKLAQPIVGMAGTPGGGYFLVASDGGIFAFGDAVFKGSTGGIPLAQPIVGMTALRK